MSLNWAEDRAHAGKQPERRLSGLDRSGGAAASPFRCLPVQIGRGIKALNPGGAGAKPPQLAAALKLPSKTGRPLIMRELAIYHSLRKAVTSQFAAITRP